MIGIKTITTLTFAGAMCLTMLTPEMDETVSDLPVSVSEGSEEIIAQSQTPVPAQRRKVRRRTRRRVKRRHERREEMKTNFISVSGNYSWKSNLA